MLTEVVKDPTIKVGHKTGFINERALYWFTVNGRKTFPAIDCSKQRDGNICYTLWQGRNCKSIIGLQAFKDYLRAHTIKRTYNDGSWGYGFEIVGK